MSEAEDAMERGRSDRGAENAPGPGWKRWAGLLFKLAVAAALLTFVATQLTWRDTARPPGAEDDAAIEGEILAADGSATRGQRPWEVERVRFRFPAGEVAAGDAKTLPLAGEPRQRLLETGAEGWRVTPGLPTLLAHLELGIYALAAMLFFVGMSLAAFRWYLLLRSARIDFSFWRLMKP